MFNKFCFAKKNKDNTDKYNRLNDGLDHALILVVIGSIQSTVQYF